MGEDVEVEQDRPILDVVKIVLDALLDFLLAVRLAAPAADLRPTGDSRLDAMAEGSEALPDLPTESFSRESFYEDRLDGRDGVPRR